MSQLSVGVAVSHRQQHPVCSGRVAAMQLYLDTLAQSLKGKAYGSQRIRFRLPGRKRRDCNLQLIKGGSDFIVYDHRGEWDWRAVKGFVIAATGEQAFKPTFKSSKLPLLKRRV